MVQLIQQALKRLSISKQGAETKAKEMAKEYNYSLTAKELKEVLSFYDAKTQNKA